ncbi:DUF4238 domain-containing protein [Weissella viridescens]|uniref:DUF4238 domain-containing protein n=1 Tax=Weissella viridescens TaxID=1629 RepID=UPI003AF24DD6
MAEKKKQHYVPQFMLRNFSENQKTVRVYLKEQGKIIENFPIKNVMQSAYTYGQDLEVERELGELETAAAIEMQRMIKNPDKYAQENETLPDGFLLFLKTLYSRSLGSMERKNQIINDTINEYGATNEPERLKEIKEFEEEELETNNFYGESALYDGNTKNWHDIEHWSGPYRLIKTNSPLFLADNQLYAHQLAISPFVLLVFSEHVVNFEEWTRLLFGSANNLDSWRTDPVFVDGVTDSYNQRALTNTVNQLIIPSSISKDDIDKLADKK